MQLKPLEHSIHAWTELDFKQEGYLLTVRNPFTGQRGQGFYLLLCSAQKAYLKAVHRYNSGSDPMQYLDPYYCSVPRPG